MSIPSRGALAEVTAGVITAHSEWDSLHQFVTLNWDSEKIAPGVVVAIDPSIHPGRYPDLMSKAALDAINDQQSKGRRTLYAFLLQFEAHTLITPSDDASDQEREQYNRDRLARTFHKRPDAVEACVAYCVDIHGRLWTAAKRRPEPDEVHEHFYASPAGAPGGAFVTALRAVAQLAGTALHGLPGTTTRSAR